MRFISRLVTSLSDKQWLIVILCVSATLHIVRIDYPARPVFDEMHFATYAANYARGEAVFDIHPPLGKIIHALPLVLNPQEKIESASYITIEYSEAKQKIETLPGSQTVFGDFPYVQMRLISALFGIALVGAVYWLLRSLIPHGHAPVIGALFVALENSMLLNSRLILLDSMYMFLSVLALALYFHPRRMIIRAGIVWGLALLIKITAITFVGPIVISVLATFRIKRGEMDLRPGLRFLVAALAVFFIGIGLLNNSIAPVEERIALYEKIAPFVRDMYKQPQGIPFADSYLVRTTFPYIKGAVLDLLDSVSGYTTGAGYHPYASMWYQWPLMKSPILFFNEGGDNIVLVGNAFVWFLGLGMIVAACIRLRPILRHPRLKKPVMLLLGGYVWSLLPFILVVKRVSFLYHYFPALLFSICLTAVIIGNFADHADTHERRQILIGVILLAIAGFIMSAPMTYGLPFVV
jgi:dolichyl-phosphate-mannose-protein mannosyltransferase